MAPTSPRPRDLRLDALRITASLLVVLIHVSAQQWYTLDPHDGMWVAVHFWNAASRAAVPLFFMISGALFLGAPTPPDPRRLWKHSIPRLLTVYVLWSLVYGMLHLGFRAFLDDPVLLIGKAVEGHYHLWFLPAILGVYILFPVLYAAVHAENGRYVRYLVAVFAFFGIVCGTVDGLYGLLPWSVSMIFQKIVPDLCGPCGYAVLGYALCRLPDSLGIRCRPRPWVLAAAACGCIAFVWGGSVLRAQQINEPFALLCGEYTLPTAAEAVCIFLLFRSLRIPEDGRAAKLLPAAAADTLGIYLIHPLFISVLEEFGVTTGSFNAWISVPLFTLGIFLLSAAAAALLRRIPAVGKWIV